jgi:DNA-binding LacI/PurR family transcriptional regulator
VWDYQLKAQSRTATSTSTAASSVPREEADRLRHVNFPGNVRVESVVRISTGFPADRRSHQADFMNLVMADVADGAVCANDETAAVLIRSLQRRRRRVPRDVRVVGFDDVRFAKIVSVPLTTVHQPCREIAATAFRAMLERLADPTLPPRTITLTPSLVIRESCGAYTTSRSKPAD